MSEISIFTWHTAASQRLANVLQQLGRLAHNHRLIRLAILLVHDDIYDRIYASRQIQHYVAENMKARMFDLLIGHLGNGDGQIADDKRQEYG